MTRITRVEIIDENGRSYVNWEDDNDITYMLQDSNRTLKVFVGKAPPEQPITEEENERYFEEAKQIVENHFAKKKMTEIEKTKKEIEVLTKKLSFLEELERTKTPAEEAFKRIYNVYPSSSEKSAFWTDDDEDTWIVFQNGYSAAQKDYKVGEYQEPEKSKINDLAEKLLPDDHPYKITDEHGETNPYKQYLNSVKEWKPSAQTPEQVEEGLRSAMRTAKEEGVFDEPEYYDELVENGVSENKQKPKTLYSIIYRWWMDIFCNPIYRDWDMETSIEDLVDRIEFWNMRIKNDDDEVELDEQENDKNFKSSLDLIKEWGEKNKPPTLKELLCEWWDEDWGDTKDKCIDMLVNIIDKKFIPPSNDTNGYEWEKCLKMMRDKLR